MSRVTVSWKGDAWLEQAFIPAGNMAFDDIAEWGMERVRGSMHAGTGPSAPFTPPNRHLNNLVETVMGEGPSMHGIPFTARVGSNAIQARILEFGGTIVPRKQKALCFPINDAARKFAASRGMGAKGKQYSDGAPAHMRGVLLALMFKYNGAGGASRRMRRKRTSGKSVTGGGYRFVFKRKKGKFTGVWGVVKRGQGKDAPFIESEPMFLVTKRVTIRARPFLRPLVNSPDRQQALRTFAANAFSTRLHQFSQRGAK